jgi:carbon storage regulator
MLVLSRKSGEQIQIDGNITVTVLGIEGRRIRLGIEAPKEVPILRSELKGVLGTPSGPISYRAGFVESGHEMMGPAVWEI